MSNTLDENLNIIAENSNLEIELLDGDLSIIAKLDDEPNDVGGMTAAELKAEFDKAGLIIQEYINKKLIPAILADDATEAAREAAENTRVSNENQRIANENARVAAEQARADENTGIVAQATQKANEAAASLAAVKTAQAAVNADRALVTTTAAQVTADRKAAETAQQGAETARAGAEAARDSIVVDQQKLAQAVAQAGESEKNAAGSAGDSEDSAKKSESWAVGGTGTRTGEDTDNAKYYAGLAQAEADRSTVPAVKGVYNVILQDRVTADRHALIVEDGRLKLLRVADSLDATTLTLIDPTTGTAYAVVVDSGRLAIEEV